MFIAHLQNAEHIINKKSFTIMAKLKYLRLKITSKNHIHEEIKSKLNLENPP
jgi:hypothetical protein